MQNIGKHDHQMLLKELQIYGFVRIMKCKTINELFLGIVHHIVIIDYRFVVLKMIQIMLQ